MTDSEAGLTHIEAGLETSVGFLEILDSVCIIYSRIALFITKVD
jgi:hypothetical protein